MEDLTEKDLANWTVQEVCRILASKRRALQNMELTDSQKADIRDELELMMGDL